MVGWNRQGGCPRFALVFQRAAAVFHARNTQPRSPMHLETDSNLYGVTVNLYNRDVSAGVLEKEHCSRYGVVVWGLRRMLEASRGLLLLMQKGDFSADISSTALGCFQSPAANNGLYRFKPIAFRVHNGRS